jgi:EAL domain-containing protein (putative c-di-GMP-specific phosphodiesterase class I)
MEQGKPLMATESPLVDFDAVCQKVRAAVEPNRTHAVSLHDELGEMLWLSESSMGPDEHNAVREAAETFADPSSDSVLAIDLGDARSAVMIRALNNRRAMVGLVMIIMDTRIVALGLTKLLTPKLQRALVQFAGMRPDRAPAPANPETSDLEIVLTEPAVRPVTAPPPPAKVSAPPAARTAKAPAAQAPIGVGPRTIAAQLQQIASRTPARPASPPSVTAPTRPASYVSHVSAARPQSPARPEGPVRAEVPARSEGAARAARPEQAARPAKEAPARQEPPARPQGPARAPIQPRTAAELELSFELDKTPSKGVPPEIDRLNAALRKSPIALHVQRLVPLSKGGQLKRYEVLLRSGPEAAQNVAPQAMLKSAVENGLGSMIDRRVISELIGWLVRHPEIWQANEVMFSVNLTTTALHDEHFIKFIELCLAKSSLPKGTIAFEVDAATALNLSDKISDVATALHRLGCPLILDDFKLRTECFELMRLPGVRYVKLAPEITAKMRTDKVSQAAITGVVQMARVLGMHTCAKRTESSAEQEWLTALGVDFVQSNAVSPPVSIETLLKAVTSKI